MSLDADTPDDRRPLDYERRRHRLSTPAWLRAIAVDGLSALPAFAVPVWAYFVTRWLTDHAGKYATMPAADVWLIVLTFAIPIGFAFIVCGPMARDDKVRR